MSAQNTVEGHDRRTPEPQHNKLDPSTGPNKRPKQRTASEEEDSFSASRPQGVLATPRRKSKQKRNNSNNSRVALPSEDTTMEEGEIHDPPLHAINQQTEIEQEKVTSSPNTVKEPEVTADSILNLPPTREEEWPHGLLAAYEPSDPREAAYGAHVAPNGGFFPRATIPLDRALLGIGPTQRKTILGEPESILLLVIFNGGKALCGGVEDRTGAAIRAKLEEMTDSREFEVYRPVSVFDDKPGPDDDMGHLRVPFHAKDDKFAPPYTYVVAGLPNDLRQFLIDIQTIGFTQPDRAMGFHALPVDNTVRSWVVGIYNSTASANDNTPKLIRKAIVMNLASDNVFRQKVGQARAVNTSMDKLVLEILGTLSVRQIPGYEKGREGYLVCIAPFTTDQRVFDDVKSYMRARTFLTGMVQITPCSNIALKPGELVVCTICKLDTHHTHSCPFRNAKDWWGPTTPALRIAQPGPRTTEGSSSGKPTHRGGRPRGRGGRFARRG